MIKESFFGIVETKSIYADLKQASLGQPWKVYLKEEFPKELHYQLSNRIPPLLLVADQPYVFLTEPYVWKTKGMHGYDGKVGSHTIFLK